VTWLAWLWTWSLPVLVGWSLIQWFVIRKLRALLFEAVRELVAQDDALLAATARADAVMLYARYVVSMHHQADDAHLQDLAHQAWRVETNEETTC
jgi:hypothetical protein